MKLKKKKFQTKNVHFVYFFIWQVEKKDQLDKEVEYVYIFLYVCVALMGSKETAKKMPKSLWH